MIDEEKRAAVWRHVLCTVECHNSSDLELLQTYSAPSVYRNKSWWVSTEILMVRHLTHVSPDFAEGRYRPRLHLEDLLLSQRIFWIRRQPDKNAVQNRYSRHQILVHLETRVT